MNNNPPTQHSSRPTAAATWATCVTKANKQALGRDNDGTYAKEWQANQEKLDQMFLDESNKKKMSLDKLNKKKKETEWILALANSMQLDPNQEISQGEHKYWQGMYHQYLIKKEKKELKRQNYYYRMEMIYEASKQPLATRRTAVIVKFATTLTEEHSYVDELYTIGPRTKYGDELYATETVTPSNTGVKILASPTMPEPEQSTTDLTVKTSQPTPSTNEENLRGELEYLKNL